MNTREGINPSPLLRTILIATGLLVSAIVLVLNFAAPQAASGDDAECENEEFRTGASAYLPDCRAYEQVSAVRKFGNAVWGRGLTVGESNGGALTGWTSPAGDRIVFYTSGGPGFEEAVRGFFYPQTAERSENGWSRRATIDGPPGSQPLMSYNSIPQHLIPSKDRSAAIFSGVIPFSPLQPPSGNTGGGAAHLAGPTGAVSWLSNPTAEHPDPTPGTSTIIGWHFAPIAVSDDLSTAYFMSRATLTPEDELSGRTWNQSWAFYKVEDGVLSNAGTLPDGTIDAAGSKSAGWDVSSDRTETNPTSILSSVNVVSPDGNRALFIDQGNRSGTPQLYMHRDGQPSLLISKPPADDEPVSGSTGVSPIWAHSTKAAHNHDDNSPGGMVIATGDRDLGVVVFATRDALLPGNPDDGTHVNTYRYDVVNDELEYLADLDRPGTAQSRSRLGNVYRVSEDASRILFWTNAGELKLWRHGESTLTLATGLETGGNSSMPGARFSEDGRTVVFMSTRPIAGEPNHPAGNGVLQTQVYRFEEGVDTVPQCISCPPADADVVGPATFDLFVGPSTGFGGMTSRTADSAEQARGTSSDARRVFFTTSSTLDPRDHNSVADVYEWSADGGIVLLSSGAPDSRGEGLVDNDEMGDNVFFVSEQQLTASDTDGIFDLYVARVGGGLPDPAPFDMEEGCETGTCQGSSSDSPETPAVGSVSFTGKGNPGESRDPKASVKVKRLRTAKGSQALFRVNVPGPGKVAVKGKKVKSTSKQATDAGTLTLRIELKAKAKRALKKRGKVKAKARVVYRSSDGDRASRKLQVTFKQPKNKKGSR